MCLTQAGRRLIGYLIFWRFGFGLSAVSKPIFATKYSCFAAFNFSRARRSVQCAVLAAPFSFCQARKVDTYFLDSSQYRFSVGHFAAKLAWSFLISLSNPSREKKNLEDLPSSAPFQTQHTRENRLFDKMLNTTQGANICQFW